VEVFDDRNQDAIAALLHEDAATCVVGSAELLGREFSRHSSLVDSGAEETEQWAGSGTLAGREVHFVLCHSAGGGFSPHSLIELDSMAEAIQRQKIRFYSPELLEHVASTLGLTASTHGPQYPFPRAT
jgi:hypothetical protein